MINLPLKRVFCAFTLNAVVLLTALVASEQKTRRSDAPITATEAEAKAGIRLPIPKNARNVRFVLTGSTQNWSLYLCFQAPVAEIEQAIQREIESYKQRSSVAGVFPAESYAKGDISHPISPAVQRAAPKWWQPRQVPIGYFIGSSHPHNYGPHFWVDTQTGTAFYFEHF